MNIRACLAHYTVGSVADQHFSRFRPHLTQPVYLVEADFRPLKPLRSLLGRSGARASGCKRLRNSRGAARRSQPGLLDPADLGTMVNCIPSARPERKSRPYVGENPEELEVESRSIAMG